MKLTLPLLLFAMALTLAGCIKPQVEVPVKHTSLVDDMTLTARWAAHADRFKLTETATGLRLFDGLTADTWVLSTGETNWQKLPNPFRLENP